MDVKNINFYNVKNIMEEMLMADPTTELAKEFLEFHNYLVRKETKFHRTKELKGTQSDIDIIAISPKGIVHNDLELKENIIAEVKNWSITKKQTLDEIYKDKFKFIDDRPKESRKQLRNYLPHMRFDKVIFCLATTEDVYNYALEKYGIKIITTGFIIKQMAKLFKAKPRWTYYPEWYNYNIIRNIMYYLFQCYNWRDKLLLEDLVWIDPAQESRYRNQFVKLNSKFFEDFVLYETSSEVFINLINKYAEKWPRWFKKQLKTNEKFWNYLTKKR